MEPSEKGGGAARGQNLPGGLQGCAGGGRHVALYPSAGSAGGEGLGRAVGAGGGAVREGGPQAACLGNGLPAERGGRGVPGVVLGPAKRGNGAADQRGARVGRDRDLTCHVEWDLEEERRALKEDQKICRSRAQKYLIETNRRRRAFEERRKQEEAKEQRFREQVLQQRKIKLQEATDKFQRAHLPFSQHKQIVQTKAPFQLEEALEKIKGSVLTPGLCLLSRNKTNFRTTDDTSSSSASRNGSFHEKQISAMVAWDKTIQESSRTNMDSNQLLFQKNLKEMQQLLEKQHLSNLENFHQEVKKTDDSESLSSLDSLEAGEQNGNYTTPSESSLTTQCDCALYNPEKSQSRNTGLLYTAQSTSSKNMHLNNCLRNVDLQNNHNLPIHDLLVKHNVLTPAEHVNSSEEESSASHRSGKKPAEFSTSGKQESSVSNAFSFLQNIKEERSKPSSGTASTLAAGHPVFNPSKAWASPDSIPGERVQDLMQDQSFKMTPQKRTISVQTSSQPIATSIILFPNQGCSTGIPSTADTLPKDKNIGTKFLKNTSGKMTETKEDNIKCIDDINPGSSLFQDIPSASVLCDVKQQNNEEEEKENTIETMSLASDTDLNSGTPAQHKTLKNNILERKRARLFTSILKKESKYECSHFKAVVMNHGISFATRPVSSIRDSLELAKIKKKSAENEKYNRKLSWCDQINQIIIENNEKCYEKNTSEISSEQLQYVQTTNNAPKTNLSIVAQPSNSMFIKNHQENSHISKPNVNTEESNKECTSLNMFMSTGSFSAKKAWRVSEDEERNPPVYSNNSRINEVNQLKSKAKITRRPRSVRAQPSFMPKKRTGTIIRLQSATEANKTLKAPGKLLAPHPPSAPLPGNRSGKNTASPGCQPLPPSSLQATTASRNDLNERHVLLADQVLNRNGTEKSESIACRSDLATAIPTPGCSTAKYEPWAKYTCSVNSVQTSACQDHSVTCTERRPANAENGLHLHRIPAAGKTSTSWQGAHTARAPKAPATGAIQHHVSHYNNSHITKWQPFKANVPHVTIDGSSFKSASRINEVSSFSANGVVPVTRQKQVFDNHENKHRAFSEHRRQSVTCKRWKPAHHAQHSLCTVQLSPVQSSFDPVQNVNNTYKSDEVSESTVQFLMAEKLASTPVAEDEILAAMESVQPARQPLLLNRAPCLGMSALSIEEQKIFQSLGRLNERLQNVQDAITRNPSASNVLQIITPLKSYNCGVDTALSSARQLIQGSSQGECPKWVAHGSGAEPDEGVTDKQPPECRHGHENAGVRRRELRVTQPLCPIGVCRM
ncbi:centrosomal protein of 126 kDa [Gavia stellata]|uniref:centrosomal protein of 126 kDa n=1 Tax=Gavia stellata TaxID=37040 RepID=UPI0028A04EC4|nr:centrosomal protein of 126 kDa [Gavia stellata]